MSGTEHGAVSSLPYGVLPEQHGLRVVRLHKLHVFLIPNPESRIPNPESRIPPPHGLRHLIIIERHKPYEAAVKILVFALDDAGGVRTEQFYREKYCNMWEKLKGGPD